MKVIRVFRWFCLVAGLLILIFQGVIGLALLLSGGTGETEPQIPLIQLAAMPAIGLLLAAGAAFAIYRDRQARKRRKLQTFD